MRRGIAPAAEVVCRGEKRKSEVRAAGIEREAVELDLIYRTIRILGYFLFFF